MCGRRRLNAASTSTRYGKHDSQAFIIGVRGILLPLHSIVACAPPSTHQKDFHPINHYGCGNRIHRRLLRHRAYGSSRPSIVSRTTWSPASSSTVPTSGCRPDSPNRPPRNRGSRKVTTLPAAPDPAPPDANSLSGLRHLHKRHRRPVHIHPAEFAPLRCQHRRTPSRLRVGRLSHRDRLTLRVDLRQPIHRPKVHHRRPPKRIQQIRTCQRSTRRQIARNIGCICTRGPAPSQPHLAGGGRDHTLSHRHLHRPLMFHRAQPPPRHHAQQRRDRPSSPTETAASSPPPPRFTSPNSQGSDQRTQQQRKHQRIEDKHDRRRVPAVIERKEWSQPIVVRVVQQQMAQQRDQRQPIQHPPAHRSRRQRLCTGSCRGHSPAAPSTDATHTPQQQSGPPRKAALETYG